MLDILSSTHFVFIFFFFCFCFQKEFERKKKKTRNGHARRLIKREWLATNGLYSQANQMYSKFGVTSNCVTLVRHDTNSLPVAVWPARFPPLIFCFLFFSLILNYPITLHRYVTINLHRCLLACQTAPVRRLRYLVRPNCISFVFVFFLRRSVV